MNGIRELGREDGIHRDLQAHLESFRKSDEARHEFVDNLVHQYQILQARYQEKCDDLTNEVASRRQYQTNASAIKRDLDSLRQHTDANVFALAIIDGDGAIFQDHLLRAGADGGSEAGHMLYAEIKRHLQERHGAIGNWTIMLQVYANFEGLSRKLAQVGVVRSPVDLHTFARAFSYNQPLFSFIDVGSGKERADHKIKEMLRLFMFNAQCKHIIFGGTHDNGYLPNLEPFKRDDSVTTRLTLLATTPPEHGFLALGMDMTRFSSVFRTEPLPGGRYVPDRSTSGPILSSQIQAALPAQNNLSPLAMPQVQPVAMLQSPVEDQRKSPVSSTRPTKDAPVEQQQRSSSSSTASQITTPSTDAVPTPKAASVSPGLVTGTGTSTSTTHADISNSTPNTKQISIAPEKTARPNKAVYLNSYDQRIDMTLPKPESSAIASLHQRIKAKKVCNNFHLLSHCSSGINCSYSHEPKLTPKELTALRMKARERPCPQGTTCRDIDCLSGHNCPRGQDCNYDYCYFGEDSHDVDRGVKMKYYSSGDIEIVH